MFLVSILRSYGARKTLNDQCYKHLVPTGRRRLASTLRQLVPARRRLVPTRRWLNAFVAIAIALSFIATLIPVASASLTKSSTMACCVGKTAGHCDSGLAVKKVPPPKSEPMCGLHGAEMEEDGITIVAQPVAEPSHSESHSQTAETNSSQPAESASLSQPCHMDCASCAAGATRQQKRERNTVQPTTSENALSTTLSFDEDQPLLFSSSRNWEHVIPRGPPANLR